MWTSSFQTSWKLMPFYHFFSVSRFLSRLFIPVDSCFQSIFEVHSSSFLCHFQFFNDVLIAKWSVNSTSKEVNNYNLSWRSFCNEMWTYLWQLTVFHSICYGRSETICLQIIWFFFCIQICLIINESQIKINQCKLRTAYNGKQC